MQYWDALPVQGGYVWQKRNTSIPSTVRITCTSGAWYVLCCWMDGGQLKHDLFTSGPIDYKGLEKCLAHLERKLSQVGEPEFDLVEARQMLKPIMWEYSKRG